MSKFKPIVKMKGKEILGIDVVEKETRIRDLRGKYFDKLKEEVGGCVKSKTSLFAWRVRNTIWTSLTPAIIRAFRAKYPDKDEEGFVAFKNNCDDDLKMVIEFVTSKIGDVTVLSSRKVKVIWDGEEIVGEMKK